MADDLSKVASRPARTARSRASIEAPAAPSVARRDVARPIAPRVGGTALFGLQQGINSFFQVARQQERKAAADRINQENLDFARQAKTLSRTRPDEVRQARETGDWSAFPSVTDEALTRPSFTDTASVGVGEVIGADMAADEGFLLGLGDTTDPDRFRREFLESQLQGNDDFAMAESASARFMQSTDALVSERKVAILTEKTRENIAVQRDVLEDRISRDEMTTVEDFEEVVGAMGTAASPLGAQAEFQARNDAYHALLDAAAEGRPWAIRIAMASDPAVNNGISIAELESEYWEEAQQGAIARVGEIQTKQQAELIQGVSLALAEGDLTVARDQLSLFSAKFGTAFAPYVSALGAYNRAVGTQVDLGSQFDLMAQGTYPGSLSDVRKNDVLLYTTFGQEMDARGLSESEVVGRRAEFLAQHNPSGDLKNRLKVDLLSGDPDRRNATVQVIRSLGPDASSKFPAEVKGLVDRLLVSEDVDETMTRWAERKTGDATVSDVLEKSYGMATRAKKDEYLGGLAEEAISASGVTAGLDTTFGLQINPFDNLDFDETTPGFRRDFENLVRVVAQENPDLTQDEAGAIAVNRARAFISVEQRDGQPRVIWRDIGLHVGQGGQLVPTRNPDTAYHEEFDGWVGSGGVRALEGRAPLGPGSGRRAAGQPEDTESLQALEVTGLVVDDDTKFNRGTIPQFDRGDGSSGALEFDLGSVHWLPPDAAGSPLYSAWPEDPDPEPRPEGVPEDWVPRIALPTDGQAVGDRMIWSAPTNTRTVTLRYIGEDKTAGVATRLDEDRPVSGEASPLPPGLPAARGGAVRDQARRFQLDEAPAELDEASRQMLGARHPADAAEALVNHEEALAMTQKNAEFMLNMSSPQGLRFTNDYQNFLAQQEGRSALQAYDDLTGRAIIPGERVKGKRTIGMGYNLERGDWDKVSRRIGLSREAAKDVFSGERKLSNTEARELNTLLAEEAGRDVYAKYKDIAEELRQHQWIALMSLWHHGVRETPKMDEAIRRKDWREVGIQWVDNSLGGFRGTRLEPAIQARRAREFQMFMGSAMVMAEPEIAAN